MPKLGEPNFDLTLPCCEAEYRRWTTQVSFNFSGNQKKNKESQASFLCTWLGEKGMKELGYYDWSETDRANPDKIFTKLKEIIHPADSTEIYRNQFYKLKQNATQTFQISTLKYFASMNCANLKMKADVPKTRNVQTAKRQSKMHGSKTSPK